MWFRRTNEHLHVSTDPAGLLTEEDQGLLRLGGLQGLQGLEADPVQEVGPASVQEAVV